MQPKMLIAVWSGFRQVPTFMRSILSTVSRSVNSAPPSESGGRPAGASSSMTRYPTSSEFT